jgi:tRNA U34 5-carboxymethylaminomethyl modifying GTPase MnmE/TrmE
MNFFRKNNSNHNLNRNHNDSLEPLINKSNKSNSYRFTIILAGDRNTGKTSFIKKCGVSVDILPLSNIGFDLIYKFIDIDDDRVEITFVDLIGNLIEDTYNYNIISQADAIYYFFDVTNTKSYESIFKWMDCFKKFDYKQKVVLQYIIGNKIDDVDNIVIRKEDINDTNGYFECSCKTGDNVMTILTSTVRKLIRNSNKKKSEQMNVTKIYDIDIGIISNDAVKSKWYSCLCCI